MYLINATAGKDMLVLFCANSHDIPQERILTSEYQILEGFLSMLRLWNYSS